MKEKKSHSTSASPSIQTIQSSKKHTESDRMDANVRERKWVFSFSLFLALFGSDLAYHRKISMARIRVECRDGLEPMMIRIQQSTAPPTTRTWSIISTKREKNHHQQTPRWRFDFNSLKWITLLDITACGEGSERSIFIIFCSFLLSLRPILFGFDLMPLDPQCMLCMTLRIIPIHSIFFFVLLPPSEKSYNFSIEFQF